MNARKTWAARSLCALLALGAVSAATSTVTASENYVSNRHFTKHTGYNDGHRSEHRAGYRDGYRDGYRNIGAGVLHLGRRSFTISPRGDVSWRLVRAFRDAGYRAWQTDGQVRVRLGHRKPRISWTSGSYTLSITYADGCAVLTPCKVARPHHARPTKPVFKGSFYYDTGWKRPYTPRRGWHRPYRPARPYTPSCPW